MKTILITGATSGIGRAAAEEMAARGWHVCGVGRSPQRCRQAEDEIRLYYPDASLTFFTADLAAQREVGRLAGEVIRHLDQFSAGRLDVLLNNAGTVRNGYIATEDGYETQFAVNHLAGFLLANRLLGSLEKSPIGRILTVSSNSHRIGRIHWHDVMLRKHYNILAAYSQSKLCNALFTFEFNRRLTTSPVRAYAVDPALVRTDIGTKDTGGLAAWFWRRRSRHGLSPFQAASTITYLCKMPAGWRTEDMYFQNCAPHKPSRKAVDPASSSRLWDLSAHLCGLAATSEDRPATQ